MVRVAIMMIMTGQMAGIGKEMWQEGEEEQESWMLRSGVI